MPLLRKKTQKEENTAAAVGKAIFWLFFLAAQFVLVRMYHEEFYKQQSSSASWSWNSSMSTTENFEIEMILQGIGVGKSSTGKPPPSTDPDGAFNGYPIRKLRNNIKKAKTSPTTDDKNSDESQPIFSQ